MTLDQYGLLVALLAGGTIAFAAYAVMSGIQRRSPQWQEAMRRNATPSFVMTVLRAVGEKMARNPGNQPILEKYRAMLLVSGPFWGGLSAAEVLAARTLLPIAGLIWGVVIGLCLQLPFLLVLALALLAALVISLLPEDGLKKQLVARRALFAKQLPGALDLLLISVHSGMDLRGSIFYLGEHYISGPVREEFQKIRTDIQLGRSLSESMLDMAARMELPDLSSLCIALSQALETGTSMSGILGQATADIRKQRLLSAKTEAQKATVSIAFPMLLLIVPGIFIVLLGPVAINMIEHVFKQM